MTEYVHPVMTIGHSNHEMDFFLDLLQDHRVSIIADVRSVPYSRYCPHFNKNSLEAVLKKSGIGYMFLGREFGARVDDPSCFLDGRIQYALLAKRPEFLMGIKTVKDQIRHNRIALMCAEEDPVVCHRSILVARRLEREGVRVEHIRRDGQVETHDSLNTRLLESTGLHRGEGSQLELGLFGKPIQDKDHLLTEAYNLQEDKIAYKVSDSSNNARTTF